LVRTVKPPASWKVFEFAVTIEFPQTTGHGLRSHAV
jgi:hypothetical protein